MDVASVLQWLSSWELSDWIRVGSMLIAFLLLAVLGDRKTWVTTDILVTVGWGLALLAAPGFCLGFLVRSVEEKVLEPGEDVLTPVQLLLCRISGVVFMCMAIARYVTRESRDGTVHITILMSRVFTTSLILMCQVYSYYLTTKGKKNVTWTLEETQAAKIESEFVKVSILGTVLWLLGNLLHLLRSNDFMTYPQHNIRLNNHLRVDAWLAVVTGVAFLAFPDYFLQLVFHIKSPNAVHLHLVRALGANQIGEAVISMQAPGFLHERDKRAQFLGRFVPQLLMLLPCLWACYYQQIIKTQQLLYLVAMAAPAFVNSFFAYVTDGTTIYRVPEREPEHEKEN